jgi:colanic acid/amylovoran biosynthesis glycosyltransferase
MAQQLVELGCPNEKIKIYHLGIATEKIPYLPRMWHPGETLRVLIAASFREKKGIPYALEALALLKTDIHMEITIIGDANSEARSQKEKQRILEIIADKGLEPEVRLLGYQRHTVLLTEAYRSHVFLSPSITASDGDTEGGAPVTLAEMMATGMPVVSTNHCDIPEIVRYGIDDWLADERDVEGLTRRIRWLIENPEKWRRMLDIGRKHIEVNFNASRQGQQLKGIYQSLLGQPDGP